MADAQLSVELSAQVRGFVQGMQQAGAESQKTAKKVEDSTDKIGNAITSKLAGVFSATAIIAFGKAVLDVTAEFQKFQAVLGNTLGSQALADLKLKEIQDFAAKTPFGVNELTASFVKLANSGFKPTGDQMTKLGDLASSTGKSFDQLAEAILDAQSGEFERLKEFGVRAKDAGDKVIFTYKGVQTTVDKTAGSIRNYITSLGDAEGVSGSMAKISETLGGKISNLGDSWDQMLLSVGGNTSGVFAGSIDIISQAINSVTRFNRELETAAKYKFNTNGFKDFVETFQSITNPFGSSGSKSTILSNVVLGASDDINKYVSKAIAGAKSTTDFGKALAYLKQTGDAALKGITDKGVQKGLLDSYQRGITAIRDAREAFANMSTSDANFGTGKTAKGVKSLTDVLKELKIELTQIDNTFSTTFGDQRKDKVGAYQKAINELIKQGIDPASAAIQKLKDSQEGLFSGVLQDVPKSVGVTGTTNAPDLVKPVLGLKQIKVGLTDTEIALKKFKDDLDLLIESDIANSFGNFGSAIGEALINGGSVIDAAGKSILSSFGGFLSEYGRLLIAYGTAALVKGKLDAAALVPGAGLVAGPLAIAAGVALQLAGAAIGAFASGRGSQNVQGNKEGVRRVPGFASGVTNFGGGLAMVGEQGREFVNLPTGSSVIPNGRTERLMRGEGASFNIINESYITGGQLYSLIRVEEKARGRAGVR